MIAQRFRAVGWAAGLSAAACGLYLVNVRVASERQNAGHAVVGIVLVGLEHTNPISCPRIWVNEGGRVSFRVEILRSNTDVASSLTVQLQSNDGTEMIVPVSVTIPSVWASKRVAGFALSCGTHPRFTSTRPPPPAIEKGVTT